MAIWYIAVLTFRRYNEYIVYDVSQIRMRYLFRVKMDYDSGY
jgi:hypothetical protein